MNRNLMLKIAMAVCIVILGCAVAVNLSGLFGQAAGGYANAEKYTAGETEITGTVNHLDINWVSGKVNVAYHQKDTVELRETSRNELSEDQKLRWWLDGDTLRVQYTSPGLRISWNLEKELTITLPEGKTLQSAQFDLTSGDLVIPEIRAELLKMNSTSGSLTAAAEAAKVEAGCTSGDQKLTLKGKTESVRMSSTSGRIQLEAEDAKQIAATSTSGELEIRAEKNEATDLSSTSGPVYVRLQQIGKLKVSSTSGSVKAVLPETPGFTAEISTTSGSVNTAMPLTKDGSRYACGDGSGSVRIDTTSGSVTLEALR